MPTDTLHLARFESPRGTGAAAVFRLRGLAVGHALDINLTWTEDGQPFGVNHEVLLHGENVAKVRALCSAVLAATETMASATDPVTRSALAQAVMREAQARDQDRRAAETPHASERASHERHAARLRERAAEHREDAGLVRTRPGARWRADLERRVAALEASAVTSDDVAAGLAEHIMGPLREVMEANAQPTASTGPAAPALPPIPEGWEHPEGKAWTLRRRTPSGTTIVFMAQGDVSARRTKDGIGIEWDAIDPPQAPAFYLLSKWFAGPGRA